MTKESRDMIEAGYKFPPAKKLVFDLLQEKIIREFDKKFINLVTIVLPKEVEPRGEEGKLGHKLVERTPEVKSFLTASLQSYGRALLEDVEKNVKKMLINGDPHGNAAIQDVLSLLSSAIKELEVIKGNI